MHAERAAPHGANFPNGKFQKAFCHTFCVWQKVWESTLGVLPPRAVKGFNWIVWICFLCVLIRGLQNLGAPLKGFNCCGVKLRRWCADSRFAKLRNSRKENEFILFACTKRTKSTPEVCEPLDSGDDSNRRSIRDFSEVTGFHQVTGNAENSSFPGIAGNDLNRCEVPALQRKDLERSEKEELCFFANSRLRGVEMGSGGWKRVALGGNKKGLCERKAFGL